MARSSPCRSRAFVPALGARALTRLYDPLIQTWRAAAVIRTSVIDALGLEPGMRVLELGSGSGRLAIELKRRHPAVHVDAVDLDPSMLARARRNAARAAVEIAFHHADVTAPTATVAPPAGFDRVYSTLVFHHLSPAGKQAALAAAATALAAGGRFVVADFGRPRGLVQHALFRLIQQPLDGFTNTTPHRDGRFDAAVRATFAQVERAAVWKTAAGTIELLVCQR